VFFLSFIFTGLETETQSRRQCKGHRGHYLTGRLVRAVAGHNLKGDAASHFSLSIEKEKERKLLKEKKKQKGNY